MPQQRCTKCEQLRDADTGFRSVTTKGKVYPRKICRACDLIRDKQPTPARIASRIPTRDELREWHANGCHL